ncbi:MAG TPA: MDR family MFS transporter [Rubrobacter sp.]|nr:MDR family MFS transporter [Rubrobacter sp.]
MSAVGRFRRSSRGSIVIAVAGLMLALFLVALDQTIVGTALPKIIADLDGFEKYAWVTTAYLLASTSMIPVIGKLGDLYGRKWFIVGGVVVFLIGSALCGAAWGMTELILFRGIQGLGAGMIFSNIFTSIADIFPDPARRAKYQGVFFAVFSLSSVIGPTLGGWITDNYSWRWVFYVNIPLGLFSLVVLPFVLRQSERRPGAKIDFLGAATITASVASLLLALSWVGEGFAWGDTRVVAGFIISAVLLAAFIPIELRAPEPVIPLSLFKSRVFTTSALLMFFVGVGMFGIILYTPLFVQGALGKTATGSGTVLTPLVFAMTFVGILGGQIIARVRRVKPFTIFGTVMMTFGVYLLTTMNVDTTQATVALYLGVTGLGLGLIMPTATLAVQNSVEKHLLGVATSSTQFVRSVGSTVGTAVIGSIVTKGYADKLDANAPEQAPGRLVTALENPQALVSDGARQALERAASAFPGGEQLVAQVIRTARVALSDSIHDGFVLVLVCTAAAVGVSLVMKNIRLEAPAGPGEEGDAADTSPIPGLAEALHRDAAGDPEDERLAALLAPNGSDGNGGRAEALLGLAERIESRDGGYPNLVSAAAALANGRDGDERERAVHASKTVIRPLAATGKE